MESEVLGAEHSLSDCTGPSEEKGGEGRVRDAEEGSSNRVADGSKVDIWSQISPPEECEIQLELLGMDGFLSNCSELNDHMDAKLAGDVKDKGGVLGGISVCGFEQVLSSQDCEMPLELLLSGGLLSDCAEDSDCNADMTVNGSCGDVKELVQEKIDVLEGMNDQILTSRGCEVPTELLASGGSPVIGSEDSGNKVCLAINGSCAKELREVLEEKSNVLEGTLPSQGCDMPLELLVTSDFLCSCDADYEGKGSCGKEVREVVEERSDVCHGTDEQTLPSQGCEIPYKLPVTGDSLSGCGEDNECKAKKTIDGSCWEIVEEKDNSLGGINESIFAPENVEIPLESLVIGRSPNTFVNDNELKVEMSISGSSERDIQEALEERGDILDSIDEQVSPPKGCEMPLELLIEGSLNNRVHSDGCEINLSVNASCCKQIGDVEDEKCDILGMINEQTTPSQGFGRPLEFSHGAVSLSNCAKQSKQKDFRLAAVSSDVRANKFVDNVLTGSQNNKSRQILPSEDCKIPLGQLPVDSSLAEEDVQKVTARFDGSSAETVTKAAEKKSDIFPEMRGEMCSQVSNIEEHIYDLREGSPGMAPDYILEKSGSPPPCSHPGVVDDVSSGIFVGAGPSVAGFLIDSVNPTNADSSGNTGREERVDDKQDCVADTRCPEIVCLPPRRSTRARKSCQNTQTAKVARKGARTANKKPCSHAIFEIFLKVVRKKRSSFHKPARASVWGALENISQFFYHNSDLDLGQFQNQGSQKARGGRGCGKRNKSRSVRNSKGSKVNGCASISHIRLKVKMGKRVSESCSKAVVPDVINTSDPVQPSFGNHISKLPWSLSSELPFTVGTEIQSVEKIHGIGQHLTLYGNLEKEKTYRLESALEEVRLADKDHGSILMPDDSDRNPTMDYLSISSKTEVEEALEGAIDHGYLDPGTSPDSEVINLIPDGQVVARVQEDLHDIVQLSSKDSAAPADVTSSNVPMLKSKKGKKKDKHFQAGNSNVEGQLSCQASLSKARATEDQGDGRKMENGLYSSENLVSSTDGITSSNLSSVQGCSTEMLPPVLDPLNSSGDGSSESQDSKKLPPSIKAKGRKLPKSSKYGRGSKNTSQFLGSEKNHRRNACRQKESQQKSARKNIEGEGVCDQVVCKMERHEEIGANIFLDCFN